MRHGLSVMPLVLLVLLLFGAPLTWGQTGKTEAPAASKPDKGTASAPKDSDARPTQPKSAPGQPEAKAAEPVAATPGDKAPGNYEKAGRVLFVAFAVALFLESALAAIFNWRPFVQTFVRGTRTVVAFVVSLVLVLMEPRLDVFSRLVAAMITDPPLPDLGFVGTVLSALMFAGGSAGINTLLVALGLRSMRTPESVIPKPLPTEAWISVRLGHHPKAPARVLMTVDAAAPQVVGIIDGVSPRFAWMRYFVRDKSRFPTSGGFAVTAGKTYTFTAETTANGAQKSLGSWGPYTIAARAIVDIAFD